MTSANGLIEQAARRAEALPLARIVAAMLGAATAFFCVAMPPRVIDGVVGALGGPVPVGIAGRALFVLAFALLAAALGWLVLTVVAGAGSAVDGDSEIDFEQPAPRRRAIGPAHPSEALDAPLPSLLAVRRGDGHPDAPPRRPIFAHELGVSLDLIEVDDAVAGDKVAEVEVNPAPDAAPPLEELAAGESEGDRPLADDAAPEFDPEDAPATLPEPLELLDAIDPVENEPSGTEPTLAELMARFEQGLDRKGPDPRRNATPDTVARLKPDQRNPDDALRDALDALQRMAARQR